MQLRVPVEDGDQAITSLSLREPTMAEYEEIMATPAALRIRKTVSIISALPMNVVAKIGVGDVVRAEAYCSSFFDIGQVIGVS